MAGKFKQGVTPTAALPSQLHGSGGMLDVCTVFYRKVFDDPVMAVLFEDKSEPHAWRLAAFFVRHFGGEDEYSPVRGYGFHPLFVHHNKGKRCRLRGKDAGTHFTITHRDRWLQYMDDACTDVGVSAGFRARVMGLARSAMGFYGPFWDDREQVEELERQLSKQKRDALSKAGCPFAKAVRSEEGSLDETKAEAAVDERATPVVAASGDTTGGKKQLATIPEARRTDGDTQQTGEG